MKWLKKEKKNGKWKKVKFEERKIIQNAEFSQALSLVRFIYNFDLDPHKQHSPVNGRPISLDCNPTSASPHHHHQCSSKTDRPNETIK